jgi:hypothetical protein
VADRCADDEIRWGHPSDCRRGYILGAEMNTRSSSCYRDVCPVIHNDRYAYRTHQLMRDADKVPRRNILEAKLNAGRAAVGGSSSPRDQSRLAVPDMIGDCDQPYCRGIDQRTARFAISCSASVVRNS